MRKLFFLISVLLLTTTAGAQFPQKLSYQAVLRDAPEHPVSTQVNIQISILQGTPDGTAVFVETQNTTPDPNGVVSIEIGKGTQVTGTINSIDWSAGPYYIKTVTDTGGGNLVESISQF